MIDSLVPKSVVKKEWLAAGVSFCLAEVIILLYNYLISTDLYINIIYVKSVLMTIVSDFM